MLRKFPNTVSKRNCVVSRCTLHTTISNYQVKQSRQYKFKTFDQVKLRDTILNMENGSHYRIFEKSQGYELYVNADKQDCELFFEHMKGEKVDGGIIDRSKNYCGKIIPKKRKNVIVFSEGVIKFGNQYLILDTKKKTNYYYWSNKLNIDDITVDDKHRTFLVVDFIRDVNTAMDYGGSTTYDDSYYELVEIDNNRKPITGQKIKLRYGDTFKQTIIHKYPTLLSNQYKL